MIPQDEAVAGIDVAKEWLDIAIHGKVERIANSATALVTMVEKLKARKIATVGLEPTGGYERLAVTVLRDAGLDVRMVDSWRLRQFAKGRGTRAKSDPIDARMISLFVAREITRPFPEPSHAQVRLTAWVREASRVEADIRRLANRRTAVKLEAIAVRLDAEIAVLKATLAEAEHAIEAILAEDGALAARAVLIASVPGVGPKTTRVILAEMPELGTLGHHAIAALAGLAPYVRHSGKKRRHAYIEGGRAALKRAGFLAAQAMARHNPWAKATLQRLRANGKAYKVAIIAIARRLMVILNAMIRSATPWNNPMLSSQT